MTTNSQQPDHYLIYEHCVDRAGLAAAVSSLFFTLTIIEKGSNE